MHYIIGCGGGGTYLLSILSKTVSPKQICLVDGDRVERKNLARQTMFTEEDIGEYKSKALATKIGCMYEERYIVEDDELGVKNRDIVFICVDNQPARKHALEIVDKAKAMAIICANEYDSAQTYLYRSKWKDTPDDPRVKFPEILSDVTRDPTKPHCAEEYVAEPQLATFNAISATFAMHLLYLWTEKDGVEEKLKTKMFSCNFNKYSNK